MDAKRKIVPVSKMAHYLAVVRVLGLVVGEVQGAVVGEDVVVLLPLARRVSASLLKQVESTHINIHPKYRYNNNIRQKHTATF